MSSEFKIRSYGRTELAQKYCPNIGGQGAYKKLMGWFSINPELKHLCEQKQRSFTPGQVALIVKVLGEP